MFFVHISIQLYLLFTPGIYIYIMYNISTSKIVIIFFLILIIITTKLFPFSFIVFLSSPFLSSSYYYISSTNDPRVRRSKGIFTGLGIYFFNNQQSFSLLTTTTSDKKSVLQTNPWGPCLTPGQKSCLWTPAATNLKKVLSSLSY